jgi:hypothetical protein
MKNEELREQIKTERAYDKIKEERIIRILSFSSYSHIVEIS